MADKKRATLSIGGTLSVASGAKSAPDQGVAVEVRRRRFAENATPSAANMQATGDAEMDRRMKALKKAQENKAAEDARREEERKQAALLTESREKAAEEARLKQEQEEADRKQAEAEEAERKRQEEEEAKRLAEQENGMRAQAVAPAHNDSKPRSLKESFKKKNEPVSAKPSAKGKDKKRGRNAYLGDLEQRYRTMPGRRGGNRKRENEVEAAAPQEKVIREVEIPDYITVGELAQRMAEKASDVVKTMMLLGDMVTVNQTIDQETATVIVEEFGHTIKLVNESEVEEALTDQEEVAGDLVTRPPVVTVMGHVDHGKTTLLDNLRNAHVVDGEAGGITQHIGAYQVTKDGRKITFLDTPGHAAFTAMRARGAQVTDIVILVVAADDGIMPQTIEAIKHAQAAEVPIIVAINKMDKPEANPERVKSELLSHDVVLEDFGGEVPAVPISALKGTGLDQLEEVVLLQADVLDLKASEICRADGVVVEACLDKGRGSVATIVVQRGTLKIGDILVAGSVWGRVRALINDRGEKIKEAGPSTPVEVLGLQGVPEAGDQITVAKDDRQAKEVAEFRHRKRREATNAARKLSLDSLFDRMAEEEMSDLNIIVKADVQGSVEAIKQTLAQLNDDQKHIKVNVIHSGVGVITETDVNLAMASGAIVVGFNVRSDASARPLAEREGIETRYYSVIYELIDDVKAAMTGLLRPEFEEIQTGAAEIRALFKFGKVRIAGCMVTSGQLKRGGTARIIRDGIVVHDGVISTIRREKDDVREISSGYECGMTFENFTDIHENDVIEAYEMKEVKRTIDDLKKLAEKSA